MRASLRRATLVACAAFAAFAPCASRAEAASVAAAPQQQPPRAFAPHTPATAVHTDFTVEINRKGQVTRVRSGKSCPDLAFNAMTYGNALQAFIRTSDGRSIPGTYRLSYDYDPKTKMVHRSVALLHAGGVDANRLSAVDEMAAVARRHQPKPGPTSSPLPDFHDITGHHH